MDLIRHILERVNFKDDSHLEELRSIFLENIERAPEFEKACQHGMADPRKRIEWLKKYFKWVPVPQKYFDYHSKGSKKAKLLLRNGNSMVRQNNFKNAMWAFSLSAGFAPVGGEHFAYSLANRSMVSAEIKNYEGCLADINLALQSAYPDEKRVALLKFKENIKTNIPEDPFLQVKDSLKKFLDDRAFKMRKSDIALDSQNTYPVYIKSDDKYGGRALIANQQFMPGDQIMLEKPYIFCTEAELNWSAEYCHYCLTHNLNLVPCSTCSFAYFCTEHCRTKYLTEIDHATEEKIIPYMECHGASETDFMSVKMILKLKPKDLISIKEAIDNGELDHTNYSDYRGKTYAAIYNMINHGNKLELKDQISNTFKALQYTFFLQNYTTYFEGISHQQKGMEKEAATDLVAYLILRHLESIPYNAVCLSRWDWMNEKPISFGRAVFPSIALCNHSCDPNAIAFTKSPFGETALLALRPIKEGEQVFISYGPLFSSHRTDQRRVFLKEHFMFTCDCTACSQSWKPSSSPYKWDSEADAELKQKEAELLKMKEAIDDPANILWCLESLQKCIKILHIDHGFDSNNPLVQVAHHLYKRALVYSVNFVWK